jgi:hypothetical protein
MPLDKSGTSDAFSVSGHWQLTTYGAFAGELRLEKREDESDLWRACDVMRSQGQKHPFGPDYPDNDRLGSGSSAAVNNAHAFYRLVFKADESVTLDPQAPTPFALFRAAKLVIEP